MDNPITGCLLVVDDDKVNRLLLGTTWFSKATP